MLSHYHVPLFADCSIVCHRAHNGTSPTNLLTHPPAKPAKTLASHSQRSRTHTAYMPVVLPLESRGGLMVSTQVCQSEGLGFKSRSGPIVYFHDVALNIRDW